MQYYSQNPRRRPVPRRYRQSFDSMNQGRRVQPFNFNSQQPFMFNNQQPQTSRFGNLSNNLQAMMGHAGTITNGVNMLRQMGSLLSLFR